MSVFNAINAREQTAKIPKYTVKNTELSVMISSLTDSPLIFTCFTMRGITMRVSSLMIDFNSTTILTHFMAPPVEPPQAPMNMSRTNRKRQDSGHRSKSAEA